MKEITIPNGVPERFINATPYALAVAAKFEPNKWKSKVLKQLRKNRIKENEATYGKDHELFGRSIASPSQIRRGIEYYEHKISAFIFEIRQVTSGNIYIIVKIPLDQKFSDDDYKKEGVVARSPKQSSREDAHKWLEKFISKKLQSYIKTEPKDFKIKQGEFNES